MTVLASGGPTLEGVWVEGFVAAVAAVAVAAASLQGRRAAGHAAAAASAALFAVTLLALPGFWRRGTVWPGVVLLAAAAYGLALTAARWSGRRAVGVLLIAATAGPPAWLVGQLAVRIGRDVAAPPGAWVGPAASVFALTAAMGFGAWRAVRR